MKIITFYVYIILNRSIIIRTFSIFNGIVIKIMKEIQILYLKNNFLFLLYVKMLIDFVGLVRFCKTLVNFFYEWFILKAKITIVYYNFHKNKIRNKLKKSLFILYRGHFSILLVIQLLLLSSLQYLDGFRKKTIGLLLILFPALFFYPTTSTWVIFETIHIIIFFFFILQNI